jgi:hypothetical protein
MLRLFFSDEKKDAEIIFKNGFAKGEYNNYDAYLVAKYFRNELGYGDRRVKNSLIAFCCENDKNFNYVLNRSSIAKIIRNSSSEWRNKKSAIYITKREIEKIRKIKNFDYQKILLLFLIFAKRERGYVYDGRWADIKRLSGLRITNREIHKALYFGYKEGMVRDSNDNHFIRFIDDETSNPEITLSAEKQILNVSKIYENYCGGVLVYCKDCGKEFMKSVSGSKLCQECLRVKRTNDVRNNVRKHRSTK